MRWWSIDELSDEWLTAVLGVPIAGHAVEPFAVSPASVTVRVRGIESTGVGGSGFDGPGTTSVLLTYACPTWRGSDDPLRRQYLFHTRPVARDLAPVARCRAARFDPGSGEFWIVLDDTGRVTIGDELSGITRGKAHLVVAALAEVHASLRDPRLADVIPAPAPIDQRMLGERYVRFVENYGERLSPRALGVANRVVGSIDAMVAHQRQSTAPRGVSHGDVRLGNMAFGASGADRAITVGNWHRAAWGPVATDLAMFLGTALDRSVRREYGDTLVAAYHRTAGPETTGGLEALRRDIHDAAFHCVVGAIVSWSESVSSRSDHSEQLWLTMFDRACEFLADLDGVPDADGPGQSTTISSTTVVSPGDEAPHPAAPGDGWNETWYLDVADPHAGVGAGIRFGVGPGHTGGWYSLTICGPDLPTITMSDPDADIAALLGAGTRARPVGYSVIAPLTHVHLVVDGVGHTLDDNRPVAVELDLHWYTAARPYQYDLTKVYEIACMVTGSITLGPTNPVPITPGPAAAGEDMPRRSYAIDAPGHRDHAWDAQNWWHTQWFWMAARFDDATHVHGVDIRLPGLPPVSMGYLQAPAAPVVPVDTCRMVDAVTDGDHIRSMTFVLEPGSLTLTFRALGHGPQVLVSHGVAVNVMPRAWGEFTRSDGRRGVGWVEWNTGSPNV